MTVGERIKALRKERKLTLKQLSQRIDISISFLSDIESGKSRPSLERLMDIAKGLDTTVSYILGEAEPGAMNGEEAYQGLVEKLHSDPEYLELMDLLSDFDRWDKRDRAELLNYLKVKKASRNIEK